MCGIVGIISRKADNDWKKEVLRNLLLESQSRGKDATGIAYFNPEGKISVLKQPEPAHKFVYGEDFKKLGYLGNVIIGHTRAASRVGTTGSVYHGAGAVKETLSTPENNDNNHPFYSPESGIAVVHNGFVDDGFWKDTVGEEGGIIRPCQGTTDSEIILRVMETFFESGFDITESISNTVFNVKGDMAIAVLSESSPDSVMVYSNTGRPVHAAWVPEQEAIVIASTSEILRDSLKTEEYVMDFFVKSVLPEGVVINELLSNYVTEFTLNYNPTDDPFDIDAFWTTACDKGYEAHKAISNALSSEGKGLSEAKEKFSCVILGEGN